MDTMTITDYQIEENYSVARATNKMDALQKWSRECGRLTFAVEHLVPNDLEGESVYLHDAEVAAVIDKVKESALYKYTDEDGEVFDYDFTKHVAEFLNDELGYYDE
jgi:hypothetical protein